MFQLSFRRIAMLVGYARVSTRDQNYELQLDALEAAGCTRIFEEKLSGAQRDRPELNAALNFVRPCDALVVWKLDRLARSLKQLIETVEMLSEREIGFRSLTENIDTTSSSGRLIFHIFGALAEFERSIIRERTTAGLASARARGRVGGRPPALSESDLRVAQTLLKDGALTVAEIAERLRVAPSTLYKHLPRPRSSNNGDAPSALRS
jgi:DNA invertase Pin-like site-specific DNA recombinase